MKIVSAKTTSFLNKAYIEDYLVQLDDVAKYSVAEFRFRPHHILVTNNSFLCRVSLKMGNRIFKNWRFPKLTMKTFVFEMRVLDTDSATQRHLS